MEHGWRTGNRPFHPDHADFNTLSLDGFLAGKVEFLIKKFLTRS
jgi:hypothetical protein